MECIFCKIIKYEVSCHLLYESENIISFLDTDPINEGHVLIITKEHFGDIAEIPIATLHDVIELSQKYIQVFKKIYLADGYSIMQNGGKFCDFGHTHFHIFPRYENDGFGWIYPQGSFAMNEEVAEEIRNELRIL